LGYVVGGIYTSLTGARTVDSSGTIQLYALGGLLKKLGFKFWDLGMQMEYKMDLGGRLIPRTMWLDVVAKTRNETHMKFACDHVSAKDLIQSLQDKKENKKKLKEPSKKEEKLQKIAEKKKFRKEQKILRRKTETKVEIDCKAEEAIVMDAVQQST